MLLLENGETWAAIEDYITYKYTWRIWILYLSSEQGDTDTHNWVEASGVNEINRRLAHRLSRKCQAAIYTRSQIIVIPRGGMDGMILSLCFR
jgi:hypothetical protein